MAYLDNLKIVLVALVIVAHAAMTYGAAGSWIYEAEHHGGDFVRGRLVGLGVPILVYVVLVTPLLAWSSNTR